MTRALLITVRLHDGRFHGLLGDNRTSEWPPSPARLFQALVAGAARGSFGDGEREALAWLQKLDPPTIAAPVAFAGQPFAHYMPNNDLDAKGGDIRRMGEVRSATKRYRPRLFDQTVPFLYVWSFEPHGGDESQAHAVARIAEQLYQLGRGVDMAWAVGEVLDLAEAHRRLDKYPGTIYHPCAVGNGINLDSPTPGSLASLYERHRKSGERFKAISSAGKPTLLFSQSPRPRFRSVAYNSPTTLLLFDLQDTVKPGTPFAPWTLERTVEFVLKLRGNDGADGEPESGAFKRLVDSLKTETGQSMRNLISRVLIGRDATEADKALRVRIVPIPSIGHAQTHMDIRRVMVEVPPNCPLRSDDIAWAFSGLEVESKTDESTGEVTKDVRLVAATDRGMLKHYGSASEGARPSTEWRTVTPIAVPQTAGRRRIDPARMHEEAKAGGERAAEQQRAARAVAQALRHVGVRTAVADIEVQREPYDRRGTRAERFAAGTRFAKERLWHARIKFAEPTAGPLVIGDGRYSGLGVMAPIQGAQGVLVFSVAGGLARDADHFVISNAMRRAVMARVQAKLGPRKPLPTFFTGHEANGTPARGGTHAHLAFLADLERRRLLVIAPHVLEHRNPGRAERQHLDVLTDAMHGLSELRAGASGRLRLAQDLIDESDDPLFSPARHWHGLTEFQATRHAKKIAPEDALIADAKIELTRRGVANPEGVEVIRCSVGPRGGLSGSLRLTFAAAVAGPILIGRQCHLGGGAFAATSQS